MVQGNLLSFILLTTCLCLALKCPHKVHQPLKVYPCRYVLRSRFNAPFIAHLRFNVTKPQRLFTDTAMDRSRSMWGVINDNQFVLTYGSFKASIPITYNEVHSVTFAVSPTFRTDITLNESIIIRSPSVLTIHSAELLTFWYKNIFQ